VIWRQLIGFDRSKVAPFVALRNAAGITVPLVLGAMTGSPGYGSVASMGAMNASYSDGSDPYALRARRMIAATVLSAVAIVAGSLCGSYRPAAIGVAVAWSLGAGLLVALGVAAADLGLLTLVMVLVFSGQEVPLKQAVHFGLFGIAGGLLQTSLSIAFWPLRRYEPERRLLSSLYLELSRMTASPFLPTEAPPVSDRATEAQSLLARLGRSHTIQGERYLSVLAQAERIRLSVLMLARVRIRWRRDPAGAERAEILDECFLAASQITADIAALLAGGKARADADLLAVMQHSADRLGQEMDAGRQLEALAGQLRSALELAASSTETGRRAFERREAARPWRLRIEGTIATLRANITLRSPAFRHALRLAGSVLAGEAAAYIAGGTRSYWLPMTIAIVLKPDFATTFSRGLLRLAGTFAGLVLATVLFHAATPTAALEIAFLFVTFFIMRCFGPANYGIFATAVSAVIVLLFALAGQAPGEVIRERGWNTLWGGVLALGAYAIWPTWERSQVSDTMANLLDAYRAYFRAVREAYVEIEQDFERELDRARIAARLARSNAEASVARFSTEPGASTQAVALVQSMLASSHRLVHAIMALEAGLAQSRPVAARPAFIALAYNIEVTLHSLAGALRGSSLTREMLPDLRDSHHALVHSGDALIERHALVNVETDRITNSLNTLTGQVLQFKS
jgi:uncharacterized membrane protein YccC